MPESKEKSTLAQRIQKSIRRNLLKVKVEFMPDVTDYLPSWELLAQVHTEVDPIIQKQIADLAWGEGDKARHDYGKAVRQYNQTLAPASK